MSLIVLNAAAAHTGQSHASAPFQLRRDASQTETRWPDGGNRTPAKPAVLQRWSYLKSIAFIAAAGVLGWLMIIGAIALFA